MLYQGLILHKVSSQLLCFLIIIYNYVQILF